MPRRVQNLGNLALTQRGTSMTISLIFGKSESLRISRTSESNINSNFKLPFVIKSLLNNSRLPNAQYKRRSESGLRNTGGSTKGNIIKIFSRDISRTLLNVLSHQRSRKRVTRSRCERAKSRRTIRSNCFVPTLGVCNIRNRSAITIPGVNKGW